MGQFQEDERVTAHETYGAHLSWMAEAAEAVFARQRGNLKREDRDEVARFRAHHEAAQAELRRLRELIKR